VDPLASRRRYEPGIHTPGHVCWALLNRLPVFVLLFSNQVRYVACAVDGDENCIMQLVNFPGCAQHITMQPTLAFVLSSTVPMKQGEIPKYKYVG
jgi:hypothetical protein